MRMLVACRLPHVALRAARRLPFAARRFPLALAPFRPRSAFRRLLRALAISPIAAWRTSVLLLRR